MISSTFVVSWLVTEIASFDSWLFSIVGSSLSYSYGGVYISSLSELLFTSSSKAFLSSASNSTSALCCLSNLSWKASWNSNLPRRAFRCAESCFRTFWIWSWWSEWESCLAETIRRYAPLAGLNAKLSSLYDGSTLNNGYSISLFSWTM